MTEALNRLKINASLEAFRNILDFYFGTIDLSTIEKMALHDLSAFDISDIETISEQIGLTTKVQEQAIAKVDPHLFPLIARNKQGEALVVYGKRENKYEVCRGYHLEKELIEPRALNGFDQLVLFQKKSLPKKHLDIGKKRDKNWFYRPIRAQWRTFVEIGVLTLFINILALAVPLFSRAVYDRIVPNYAIESLYVLATGVAVALIFDIILKSSRIHLLEESAKRISHALEEELFRKVLSVSRTYDRYMVGTKVNLFRELDMIKSFFTGKIVQLLDLPFFFIALTVIYIINPMMASIPLVGALLALGVNFIMQYPIASLYRKSFKEAQSRHGYLVEQIQGDEAIRLANAIPAKLHVWRRMIGFYHDIQKHIVQLNGVSTFASQAIVQGVYVLTIIVGVHTIHAGTLSVGGLIAITILSGRAMVPVIQLSNVVSRFKQVKESLESLNNYWHLPTETAKHTEIGIGRAKGKIEFSHVGFRYPDREEPSIVDVTFTIKPGERVGIIGQTGAGKSTIQKLLTGIYHPQEGRIFLDDQDISVLHPVELRQNIALMPQEPYLFSGTLKENLELSRPLSKREMMELLQKTGLMPLVKGSAQAEMLDVGERGENLSVGQRHLVGLARALVNDAPVLILDEPTTGLDVGLERRLIEHLKSSAKEKTLIVITHRFAALDLVDRVILMDRGRVVADGPKEKVLSLLRGDRA